MKITTAYQSTPGLWQAYDADTHDGAVDAKCQPVGYGTTEPAAINNLVEMLVDQAYDRGVEDRYLPGGDFWVLMRHAVEALAGPTAERPEGSREAFEALSEFTRRHEAEIIAAGQRSEQLQRDP